MNSSRPSLPHDRRTPTGWALAATALLVSLPMLGCHQDSPKQLGLTTLNSGQTLDSLKPSPDTVPAVQAPTFGLALPDPTDSVLFSMPMGVGADDAQIEIQDDKLVISIPIPNLKESSIHIQTDSLNIQISADQESVQEQRDASGQVVSRSQMSSSYFNQFSLPEPVRPEGMKSHYDKGTLYIELPRKYKEA